MTIEEFAKRCNKSVKTVKKWIESGYVPSAVKKDNDYFIPETAREPYTGTRAKTGSGILKSILIACDKRFWISHFLYGISDIEFQFYIKQLENRGLISSLFLDGIKYYNITIKGSEYLRNENKLKKISESFSLANSVIDCLSIIVK